MIENGLLSAGASSEGGSLGEGLMAQMSAKFREMGEQAYVGVEKVKESNRVL